MKLASALLGTALAVAMTGCPAEKKADAPAEAPAAKAPAAAATAAPAPSAAKPAEAGW